MCLHTCVYKHIDIQSSTQVYVDFCTVSDSLLLPFPPRCSAAEQSYRDDFKQQIFTLVCDLKDTKSWASDTRRCILQSLQHKNLLGQSQPSIMLPVTERYEYSVWKMDNNNCRWVADYASQPLFQNLRLNFRSFTSTSGLLKLLLPKC